MPIRFSIRLCLFLCGLCALTLLLGGCVGATTKGTDTSDSNLDSNGQPVSSIPWNTPQSWEGGGALGSALGR